MKSPQSSPEQEQLIDGVSVSEVLKFAEKVIIGSHSAYAKALDEAIHAICTNELKEDMDKDEIHLLYILRDAFNGISSKLN